MSFDTKLVQGLSSDRDAQTIFEEEDIRAMDVEELMEFIRHLEDEGAEKTSGAKSKAVLGRVKQYLHSPPSRGNILGGAAALGVGKALLAEDQEGKEKGAMGGALQAPSVPSIATPSIGVKRGISKPSLGMSSMSKPITPITGIPKAAQAEEWGRELAREDLIKTADAFRTAKQIGRLGDEVARAATRLHALGKEYGPKVWEVAKKSTPTQRAVAGAAAGGLAGYASGKEEAAYDFQNGGYRVKKPHRKLRAAAGAAVGGLTGLASHQQGRQWLSAHAKGLHKLKTEAQMKKTSAFGPVGTALSALAARAGPMLSRAAPAVGGVLQYTKHFPTTQAAGVGAALGGVRGFVKGLNRPRDPNTGQRQGSLVGSTLGGAAKGAFFGLGAKAFAGEALKNPRLAQYAGGGA